MKYEKNKLLFEDINRNLYLTVLSQKEKKSKRCFNSKNESLCIICSVIFK